MAHACVMNRRAFLIYFAMFPQHRMMIVAISARVAPSAGFSVVAILPQSVRVLPDAYDFVFSHASQSGT